MMPGMQRGKAKLLMMPMVMLKMGKLNPCAEERAKLTKARRETQRGRAKMLMLPGMQRGQAKLLMMPEKNPMVMLKMAELNSSTEETNTILMQRRKAELNNV